MTQTYRRTGKMVERRIRDEHILVPVGDNLYELDSLFTLNEVASFIWSRTENEALASSISDGVVQHYDVPREEAEADTRRILSELVKIGALATREAATN